MRPLLIALATLLFLPASAQAQPAIFPIASPEAAPPTGMPEERAAGFAAHVLAIHNRERAAVGAPPLQWDPQLAAGAARYGRRLAAIGELVHAPREERGGSGENLWMGTAGAFSLDTMLEDWAGERSQFRPGIFPRVSSTGNWGDVGHYTQMIWPGSTRIGCALQQGEEWDYFICRYSPTGNVLGDRIP